MDRHVRSSFLSFFLLHGMHDIFLLQGSHGIKRFIRDGHHTMLEDKSQRFYDVTFGLKVTILFVLIIKLAKQLSNVMLTIYSNL